MLLDYGMGNLPNVLRAIRHLGFEAQIESHLLGADKVILPGVGAFGAAMARLQPLVKDLKKFVEDGGPLMGICLGQQLLFEVSFEHGETPGLGILGGKVNYLSPAEGVKIPHMGWNTISVRPNCPLHAGFHPEDQYYFVHSLHTVPDDSAIIASRGHHGQEFVASVQSGNVWGTQFHPEKSGAAGLRILENFLRC